MVNELRPYQVQAIADIRTAIRAGKKRILVCAMVGAGKTRIFSEIALLAHSKGSKTLTLVHRIELANQAVAQYERAGLPAHSIGVMVGDHPRRNSNASHQIASVQTLLKRPIPQADIVIVDECKHAAASSYTRILEALPASIVIGFDATPIRYDGKGLGDIFERLVLVSKPSELIAQGYLVEPTLISPRRKPDLSNVATRCGDFVLSQLETACNTQELRGDIVRTWKRHSEGVRTLCFATTVKHSREIVSAFLEAGVPAEHVDAETPAEERAATFQRLRDGITLVLSNVMIAGEGTDLPSVKTVILARPTKSLAVYIQAVGRALRPDPANPNARALVIDHVGNLKRFGAPHHDHEWSLDPSEIKGIGVAPMKHCDTWDHKEETGCPAMSATAKRYCAECKHPFYPRCPRCKTRYSPDGEDIISSCARCDRGITPLDMDNVPATVNCKCCATQFVPFRDLAIDTTRDLVTESEQDPEEAPALALSEKQSSALTKNGIKLEGITQVEANKTLDEIFRRQRQGLCTLKQAKILKKYRLRTDVTFEQAREIIDVVAANRWKVPDSIVQQFDAR